MTEPKKLALKPVRVEKLVDRAIRNTLTDIASMETSDRIAAIKVAIDFIKVMHKIDESNEGSEFAGDYDITQAE